MITRKCMTYDATWLKPSVAADRRRVAGYGTFSGIMNAENARYLRRCTAYHGPSGTTILFTRDVDHHRSGWWKNPDYDMCYHLSLSFVDPTTGQLAPRDRKLTKEWVGLFFGDDRSMIWCEPPFTPEGKARETWHYRLFCTPAWTPILPRGEVYTREFTEAGWMSYSDVRAALDDAEAPAIGKGPGE